MSLKSTTTYIFSHYFAIIKVDSYDSLPIEKILTFHNIIILIKSALNKDKNHYYYKIFLEKCSNKLDRRRGKRVTKEKFYAAKNVFGILMLII